MAQRKTQDQFLRKAFDTVYREIDHIQDLDVDEVKGDLKKKASKVAQTNRRTLGMSLIVVAGAVLVIALLFATQALADYSAWANRPTFAERLTAPYALENQFPPYLLNAVTVDAEVEELLTFTSANITTYRDVDRPASTGLLWEVVQLQSIVPAQIGDYTLQWNRSQSTLQAQCLLMTATQEQGKCGTLYTAEFVEPANFVDSNGNRLSLVMTKFASNDQATSVMGSMFNYARKIGRTGNFSFTNMHNVDYFYSVTRETSSFSWLNNNWVLSVSAANFDTIDAFMEVFPLYENNPNLANYPVGQISAQSSQIQPPADAVEGEEEAVDPALTVDETG